MNPVEAPWLASALYNGVLVTTAGLEVPSLGPRFSGGEGLYETMRVRHGRVQMIEAHAARLTASLHAIGAVSRLGSEGFAERCAQVIAANAITDGNLKGFFFKDAAGWSELIMARGINYAAERYVAGFRLQRVPCALRTELRHGVKALGNQDNVRAKRSVQAAGFDEAVLVDPRGVVLEGASTNVFIVKGGVVGTPHLPSKILPGVMRGWVIGSEQSGTVRERAVLFSELLQADEVFVTNALMGIMPVVQVDDTRYDLAGNPVTRALMAALAAQINPARGR